MLERAAEKTMVVSLGSPYFISDFPAAQNYMCAFSNSTVSEMSAVKALFGEIPVHGRLPVTIPNFAQRGTGLDLPASGGSAHAQ
jgi:beta-N-acetylhexosaminidase